MATPYYKNVYQLSLNDIDSYVTNIKVEPYDFGELVRFSYNRLYKRDLITYLKCRQVGMSPIPIYYKTFFKDESDSTTTVITYPNVVWEQSELIETVLHASKLLFTKLSPVEIKEHNMLQYAKKFVDTKIAEHDKAVEDRIENLNKLEILTHEELQKRYDPVPCKQKKLSLYEKFIKFIKRS